MLDTKARPARLSNSIFVVITWHCTDTFIIILTQEFELFYKKWIEISGRENNMDEFGNLIFLQGMSPKWNKMTHRLIVKEQ